MLWLLGPYAEETVLDWSYIAGVVRQRHEQFSSNTFPFKA